MYVFISQGDIMSEIKIRGLFGFPAPPVLGIQPGF